MFEDIHQHYLNVLLTPKGRIRISINHLRSLVTESVTWVCAPLTGFTKLYVWLTVSCLIQFCTNCGSLAYPRHSSLVMTEFGRNTRFIAAVRVWRSLLGTISIYPLAGTYWQSASPKTHTGGFGCRPTPFCN